MARISSGGADGGERTAGCRRAGRASDGGRRQPASSGSPVFLEKKGTDLEQESLPFLAVLLSFAVAPARTGQPGPASPPLQPAARQSVATRRTEKGALSVVDRHIISCAHPSASCGCRRVALQGGLDRRGWGGALGVL